MRDDGIVSVNAYMEHFANHHPELRLFVEMVLADQEAYTQLTEDDLKDLHAREHAIGAGVFA